MFFPLVSSKASEFGSLEAHIPMSWDSFPDAEVLFCLQGCASPRVKMSPRRPGSS